MNETENDEKDGHPIFIYHNIFGTPPYPNL